MPRAEPRPRQPTLFAIASWRGFVDDLAAGLLAMWPEPTMLARAVVLLPNRRAVRALTEAFVRQSAGRALLLPRLSPVGDIDTDEAFGSFAEGLERPADLAREIAPLPRRVALMRLLHRPDADGEAPRPAAESFALAGQLAAALDTLEIERKRALDLRRLDPGGRDLQAHWDRNLKVLELIAQRWPGVLVERGQVDATHRRNLLLDALARRWDKSPPAHPVVLAGFASAPPAVMDLARVVARLPAGMLVLPGLDLTLDADEWDAIGGCDPGGACETHPQFAMHRILDAVGVGLAEVEAWPHRAADVAGSPPERAATVAAAMRPALRSGGYPMPVATPGAFDGVQWLEAATPGEEALAIAVALRQVVDHPGRTAALVTPDRGLAQRVRVQLARFGIAIDDSAGEPLSALPGGGLMLALASALAERFAPVALLALLKHPLLGAPDRAAWLGHVRALDKYVLRGLAPPPGLNGVAQRIVRLQRDPEARLSETARARVGALLPWWVGVVTPLLGELDALAAAPSSPADAVLGALRRAGEALVGGALAGERLWASQDGRCLARMFEELDECRADLAPVRLRPDETPEWLHALLGCFTIRPAFARHPQLAILSPLEARLQRADVLVLGGLNEGVWPGTPPPDPWLAPVVRRELALPGLPRRIGLQAHDFVAALGAPEVLLTRSVRLADAPSVPSRFWQRLRVLAGDARSGALLPAADALLAAARALDRDLRVQPMRRPAPAPPASARPRALSVTEVAMLKADPFAFYARHMLQLRPLDPLEADPTAAARGIAVHAVLDRWFRDPATRAAGVPALVGDALRAMGDRPDVAALWRARLTRLVEWAIAETSKDEADHGWRIAASEAQGQARIDGVTLRGRADRIDRGPAGYRIIDYKTGAMPPVGKVLALYDPQLALLAALLARGGVADLPAGEVAALDYWHLTGLREAGDARPVLGRRAHSAEALARHIAEVEADFRRVAARYLTGDAPFEAKLHPLYSGGYTDYDRLARLAEWLGQ